MTTARQWLEDLNRRFIPNAGQFDVASRHRAAIEARLNVFLGINEMFEIGSLRHGTGVWLYSDADYLVSLKGIQPGSPWTMLNKVKRQLEERFPTTTVIIRRPAVVCKFSGDDVEIVPGYPAALGYNIANPADGWMTTYPKDHNRYVNKVNKKHGGAAKKLARLVKIWKYKRDVPISSCYLEMKAAKHMDGETSFIPQHDLYLVLKSMLASGLASMNDPTGLGSRFGACSTEANRIEAMSKLRTAVGRSEKAKDHASLGHDDRAISQLELLFDY